MGGFKKVIQRAPYKERSQPKSRQKLGLLEKKKDYSLRAKAHNKKKAELAALREKAANRNEDEFYFGMMSRTGPGSIVTQGKRWNGTVIGKQEDRSMDLETVRILKTQDRGYVRTARNVASREVERLRKRVIQAEVMLEKGNDQDDEDDEGDDDFDFDSDFDEPKTKRKRTQEGKAKKILFFDEKDDMEQKVEEADMGHEKLMDEEREGLEMGKQLHLGKLKRRLEQAEKKLSVLTRAEEGLELQRVRMAKTHTKGLETKKGEKIKVRERKR